MENKFLITVIGVQEIDGEKDKVEVITTGDIKEENGKKYISYTEYDNENPNIKVNTVVEFDENCVCIIRTGDITSRLILEKDKRHSCQYSTVAGDMMIGVFTDCITDSLSTNGGELFVSYQLDFNCDFVSNNELHIIVKEKV